MIHLWRVSDTILIDSPFISKRIFEQFSTHFQSISNSLMTHKWPIYDTYITKPWPIHLNPFWTHFGPILDPIWTHFEVEFMGHDSCSDGRTIPQLNLNHWPSRISTQSTQETHTHTHKSQKQKKKKIISINTTQTIQIKWRRRREGGNWRNELACDPAPSPPLPGRAKPRPPAPADSSGTHFCAAPMKLISALCHRNREIDLNDNKSLATVHWVETGAGARGQG